MKGNSSGNALMDQRAQKNTQETATAITQMFQSFPPSAASAATH